MLQRVRRRADFLQQPRQQLILVDHQRHPTEQGHVHHLVGLGHQLQIAEAQAHQDLMGIPSRGTAIRPNWRASSRLVTGDASPLRA